MQTVLMVAHLIISALLVGIILLQRTSEDSLGGLSGGSGFSGIMSVRSSASFFSKLTVILAVLFMVNCLVLANLSLKESKKSILSTVSAISVQQSIEVKQDQKPVPLAQ